MSDFKNRVLGVAKDINNLLTSDFCSGFPYLKLEQSDYSVKPLESAYGEYARLIKTLAYEGNWKSNKVSFFDIHPIFSNAVPIPDLMGFHLSLLIFQKGLAGATETLYFDTKTNWAKFSPVQENRVFSVSSWIKFNRKADLDILDENVNSELYLPINVHLTKGAELSSINKQAPTKFDENLIGWYQQNKPPKTSDPHREILINEIELFRSLMQDVFQKDAEKFESSTLYLYALILCREFGINHDIFSDVVTGLNLKFDFISESDIIYYSQCCFHHLENLKIKIGDYDKFLLKQDQIDVTLQAAQQPSKSTADTSANVDELPKNGIKPIEESIVNYHVQGQTKFYEMKPALVSERDCRIEITRIWTRLVQCFYLNKLNKDNFNLMRNLMDTHIVNAIKQYGVLRRDNFDIQYRVMQDVAYQLYLKTDTEFKTISEDVFYLGEQIYKRITPPDLTQDQINTMQLMNTVAKKDYSDKVFLEHKEDFIVLLKATIAKFGHSSVLKELGARFSNLETTSFRTIVLSWYIENYIQSYIDLDSRFKTVYKRIESDQQRFNEDDYFKKSIFSEIKTFVKTQDNPFQVLDLNTRL